MLCKLNWFEELLVGILNSLITKYLAELKGAKQNGKGRKN
jgi:hypothetical protein